jgi:hypothetical protein
MNEQLEPDEPAGDPTSSEPADTPPSPETAVPIIQTHGTRAGAKGKRRKKSRQERRPRVEWDPATLHQMTEAVSASPPSSGLIPGDRPVVRPSLAVGKAAESAATQGPRGHRRIPATVQRWGAFGLCELSTLTVIFLLIGLLREAPRGEAETPHERSLGISGGSEPFPEFPTERPAPAGATAGIRPMDAAERARRREAMASFAEMGQAEEAELRAGQATRGAPPRQP